MLDGGSFFKKKRKKVRGESNAFRVTVVELDPLSN